MPVLGLKESDGLKSVTSRTGTLHQGRRVHPAVSLTDVLRQLFLDHLPNTDQYYKSFMHRDVVNFCIATKCV